MIEILIIILIAAILLRMAVGAYWEYKAYKKTVSNNEMEKQIRAATENFIEEKKRLYAQVELKDNIIEALKGKNAKQLDFQNIRVNAIIFAMLGMLSNPSLVDYEKLEYRLDIIGYAFGYADELVERIKNEQKVEKK